jgi:hypothetical protein
VDVIPDNRPMTCLDNMEIIDPTDPIKYVEVVANGTIMDNPNPKWRYQEEFLSGTQEHE